MNRKICNQPKCRRVVLAKGLCNMHYKRLYRGDDIGNNKPQLYPHGLTNHELYKIWEAMRSRCNNPKNPQYKNYGGRGITICKRWDNFALFLKDMGERPEGMSIDRINNNKGYSPKNCHWATSQQQRWNMRLDKRNSSGVTGVSWHKLTGKWRATIHVGGKQYGLGLYSTVKEAAMARIEAERKYHA